MIDPYYRTIAGLQRLIIREWIGMGHPFASRAGISSFRPTASTSSMDPGPSDASASTDSQAGTPAGTSAGAASGDGGAAKHATAATTTAATPTAAAVDLATCPRTPVRALVFLQVSHNYLLTHSQAHLLNTPCIFRFVFVLVFGCAASACRTGSGCI